jgi:hypothetical protein
MKKLNLFATTFVATLTAISCQNNEISTDLAETTTKANEIQAEEYKSPNGATSRGVTENGTFYGREITYENIGGVLVREGDIVIDPSQLNETNRGTIANSSARRWAGRVVIYDYSSGLSQAAKDKFIAAAQNWANNAGFTFRRRTTQTSYINVVENEGCSSIIGRTGGRQNLSLARDCSVGNAIHEIGHAIGLEHEQSRGDRDSFVTINTANIIAGRAFNFNKCSGCTFNGSLDLGSIMMYGSFFFSSNGRPTITRKDGSTFNVQRNALSANDLAVVNSVYR